MVKVSKVRTRHSFGKRLLAGWFLILGILLLAAAVAGVSPFALGNLLWILPTFGVVTNTAPAALAGGRLIRTFTVTATADADVSTGNIAHGFLDEAGAAVAPDFALIMPLLVAGVLKGWAVTTLDATNIALTGQNVVGSGNAGAQIRVVMFRIHGLVR